MWSKRKAFAKALTMVALTLLAVVAVGSTQATGSVSADPPRGDGVLGWNLGPTS